MSLIIYSSKHKKSMSNNKDINNDYNENGNNSNQLL